MNLAIRGIDANLGPEWADTFHKDVHKSLKADYILANPPFNISDWGQEHVADDVRWKYGTPPKGNANFAWVQHMIHHLGPNGTAGIVLANGSMSTSTSGEGEIRKSLIEEDLIDCMVALPGQLFYSTQIPVCLWFLARNKSDGKFRKRSGEFLFIDARNMGNLIDRKHRLFSDDDIAKISETYHSWRSDDSETNYVDEAGFCISTNLDVLREHEHVLSPGRYVGSKEVEDTDDPFSERFPKLVARLESQFQDARELEGAISKNMGSLQNA